MSLESLSERIRGNLDAFAGLDARVKFEVEDEGPILIDATRDPPELSHEDGEAACTVHLSEERMMQLLDGSLSPTLAYTLGQIRVEGSLGVAMKLANLLER